MTYFGETSPGEPISLAHDAMRFTFEYQQTPENPSEDEAHQALAIVSGAFQTLRSEPDGQPLEWDFDYETLVGSTRQTFEDHSQLITMLMEPTGLVENPNDVVFEPSVVLKTYNPGEMYKRSFTEYLFLTNEGQVISRVDRTIGMLAMQLKQVVHQVSLDTLVKNLTIIRKEQTYISQGKDPDDDPTIRKHRLANLDYLVLSNFYRDQAASQRFTSKYGYAEEHVVGLEEANVLRTHLEQL